MAQARRRVTLAVCITLAIGALPAGQLSESARSRARGAIVMLKTQSEGGASTIGAGLVVATSARQVYIATANHLVRQAGPKPKVSVQFAARPGEWFDAGVLDLRETDLDLVMVGAQLPTGIDASMLAGLGAAQSSTLTHGTDVYPMGFPGEQPWSVPPIPDKVMDRPSALKVVFQSSFAREGNSGGALLDRCGRIVGMVTAINPPEAEAVRIELLLQTVQGLLRSTPVTLKIATSACGAAAPTPTPDTPPAAAAPPVKDPERPAVVHRWSGWEVLPGGTTDVGPAAASVGESIYVFARGIGDAKVYTNSRSIEGTSWTGWTEVPGNATTNVSLAATARRGSLHLFAKGIADNGIYMSTYAAPLSQPYQWFIWSPVPGGGTTDAAPSAVTFDNVYLFSKGIADKKVYMNVRNQSRGFLGLDWSGWSEVPGGALTDAALASTVAGSRLYLFAKGLERRVWVNRLMANAWGGWRQVPGELLTDVALSAAGRSSDVTLVAKGVDGRILVNTAAVPSDAADERWSGWQEVPGSGVTDRSLAVHAVGNRFFLFSKGIRDRQVYVNISTP